MRSLRGRDSTWPKAENEVKRKKEKPAKEGNNDEEDADIGVLQSNVCQRDKGGRGSAAFGKEGEEKASGSRYEGLERCGTWEKGETCEWT